MVFWRWVGRPLAWLLSAIVLIAVGGDLRPWLDGGAFEIATPIAMWRKAQRAVLEVRYALDDAAPLGKGQACLRARDYVCAEFMFGRQLETAPKDPRALGGLAIAQFQLNRYRDSIATAESAFALGQANFELFRAYADSLERVGRAADSIKWNYRALGAAPKSHDAYEALIRQLITQGRPEEALTLATTWDTALTQRNRRPEFIAQRILIEEMLAKQSGQPRRAKAELRLTRIDDHFHAPVKLGQNHFVAFVVDTGAAITTLSRDSFTEAKAPSATLDRDAEMRVADGRTVKGVRVRLGELRVGESVLKNIEAFVCDACALLLGQNALQNFTLQQRPIEGVEYLIMTER